jgi:squalene-hopene/tetraprenyl-beta-curcumene cyclase
MSISLHELDRAYQHAVDLLLSQRNAEGYWSGSLSVSPLATAVAIVALHLVDSKRHQLLIERGLQFLARTQNMDGGWGDTLKSISNIATTMLAHAAFHATGNADRFSSVVSKSSTEIQRRGSVAGLRARYGKDQTFSTPILTCCALAGTVEWSDVPPLPFEWAWLPPRFYRTVRLPVVSYALPALIAIGQVRHAHGKPWNPLTRWLRNAARSPTLIRLESIQPPHGGFLEATPLTAFVTMSLAGMNLRDHAVVRRGVDFLVASAQSDGGWSIDTNLATWVTTLSINALGPDTPMEVAKTVRSWLIGQQYQEVHPYTMADPGGWAWTHLPGGVPDADDTSGALLALKTLDSEASEEPALKLGAAWLRDLQNADGGFPTFCRGWGTLPFDRSSPDITAHAIRALNSLGGSDNRNAQSVLRGLVYLKKNQRPDGAWNPLWFGNQYEPHEENPTYGTSRVLLALAPRTDSLSHDMRFGGLNWLSQNQNSDGGWGAGSGTLSSVEETALAVEALADCLLSTSKKRQTKWQSALEQGTTWLVNKVMSGNINEVNPIGFYFAKLWYFEELYPIIWSVAALRKVRECLRRDETYSIRTRGERR